MLAGTLRLGRVLDEDDVVTVAHERFELGHRGHLSVEMYGHDRPGARADRVRDLRDVDQRMLGLHVDEHRPGAEPDHGRGRRDERVGLHDDLVAGRHPGAPERELECIGAVGDADAIADVDELCVRALEIRDRAAVDERAGGDDLLEALFDLVGYLRALRGEIDERNTHLTHDTLSRTLAETGAGRWNRAGVPSQSSPAGTSRVTTEPIPTMAQGPIVTFSRTMTPAPR